MKYANQVSEVMNAFSPAPLKIEQMEQFYCDETMECRTSDKYDSPIEDIVDICREPQGYGAFLLLGHTGCGKSTELNRMSKELIADGYYVKTVNCTKDLDLFNIVYSDLFILMGEALLETAKESGCKIKRDVLDEIDNFWRQGIQIDVSNKLVEVSAGAGVTADSAGLLTSILRVFGTIKTDLKLNKEIRQEYRKKINICSGEWIGLLGKVADEITEKTGGKRPIIIFEDLDKLNPEDAWSVFYNYAAILSGMSFPVIYTFPIGLSYDRKFAAMDNYFITKTLPMIKIQTIDNKPFENGINVIRKIVEKRASLTLFDEGVLEKMIQYTGGSLRDLFHVINAAAKRAERRDSETISVEDAERALEEVKTSLTRRIEEQEYQFLLNIYNGNKERIGNKDMLLKMLQASVVLEYNGKRWHNVHPLVVKFFKEQGLIKDAGK